MSSQPRWRVPPDATFRWRTWDGDYVLYHDNSGDTHFLNALGARAIERLQGTSLTAGDLARDLAAEFGVSPWDALTKAIDEIVVRFADLGLIEPLDDSGEPFEI